MRKTLLSVCLGSVLLLSACSQEATETSSPPDDPRAIEWCESFKRMENSTHSVESGQASADARDVSLSPEQRTAAATRYKELLGMPVNESADAECTGPVWDRFYEETKVRASSIAAAPTTTVSPEQAQYTQYAAALTAAGITFRPGAGLGSGAFSSDQSICKSMRDGTLDAYNLAGREQVAAQTDNGRRIVTMVPILCPDQQPLIDEALSGNAVMKRFIDGKYIVGEGYNPSGPRLVAPGTYSTGPVSDCYWERADSQGNIIDNNMVSISQSITVTIEETDGAFTSNRCGPWNLVD
ncbi:hypothetical protein [Rhodococcus globerulus]|uniref:hypothetical protein n=1 Tax=Rhodococcus globerulus TaxID=33008 RepID=UPI0030194B47